MTVFINVKIDSLNESSNVIPEIVKKRFKNNKVIIKISNDKKYLSISVFSILILEKKFFLLKIFLGLTLEIKTRIENLNRA